MSKYVFEMYEHSDIKGILFKGYQTINSDSVENAKLSAQQIAGDTIKLYQVYFP